jgi:hypothetical protein
MYSVWCYVSDVCCLHSAKCQRLHGALKMKGAGLAHGEPTENFWAMLGEFGWSTQYMHLHNRRGRLERAALWYAEGVAARLPTTLHDMLFRALDKRGAAIAGVRGAVEALRLDRALGEPEVTNEQVCSDASHKHVPASHVDPLHAAL